MASDGIPEILWSPPNAGKTPMDVYRRHVNQRFHQNFKDTQQLQLWSCDKPQDFWVDLYSYLNLVPPLPSTVTRAYDDSLPMSANPPFFEGLKMNYAENAMFSNPNPDAVALIGLREDQDLSKEDGERLTWHQFREQVRLTASALKRGGVGQGDRVAALVATSIWAVVLFHATASIGAIFTSISPDLGLEGCVARLQQVTPSILFADNAAIYKGKTVQTITKLDQILSRLKPRPQTYVIPIVDHPSPYSTISKFLEKADPSDKLTFTRVSFNDPLLIAYSSGTTGTPKCIVHRHGLILQFKKISVLHNYLGPDDVIMAYCSTSWIVFSIMCGHFSVGATTICYNGSPLYPATTHLLRVAAKFGATFFGTSPRYLLEVEMSKCIPKSDFDLSKLKLVYTTGATLSIEQYRWFYRAFPSAVQLCNTAGGTDTSTSLIALDPSGPIYAGEMQIRGLGMDIDVADPSTGDSILHTGDAGELVIRKPFPSAPCFFWGDADGSIYRASYFERFDRVDVWAQHDWLARNPRTGGWVMSGRSDGVLNPSGIRFGSGEIYAIVETAPFTDQLSNTLCVGRRRPHDHDEEVFLFVVPKAGHALTPSLRDALRSAIRAGLSPRHVPRYIVEVPEIPVTINGKKVEVAVKQVISGKDVTPSATVANPDSIAYFARFRQIEAEPRAAKL